jgi:hypothetical protein
MGLTKSAEVKLAACKAAVQVPPAFEGDFGDAMRSSRELQLERVMAKKRDSSYRTGRRSSAWIKVKHHHTQEVIVGGWRPGKGRRAGGIGSFLVGIPSADGLHDCTPCHRCNCRHSATFRRGLRASVSVVVVGWGSASGARDYLVASSLSLRASEQLNLVLWGDLTHLLGVKPLVTNSFSWEDKRMSKFYGTAGPAITVAERRAANPLMTTHIGMQALSASQWRVWDKRWPEHDARSVLGFIEKRAERFDVIRIYSGLVRRSFGSSQR